ncbi:MAG: NAD(P)H-dependent glycerol-3-phosphate dehydrogenase [Ruminococcaceae bacterium]|nr:NAD(P)H-dependent glycerol-3-phosphate dehydrogenase [Oscillospiraceae bacterium]
MAKIAVVGSGSWGTAAAVHLNKNGHDVTLWSWLDDERKRLQSDLENKEFLPGIKLDSNICFTSDISCVKDKDLVVLVTPSKAIRSTARAMAPHVTKGTIVVILSKGIEDGTLKTLSEVVSDEIPQARVAVMSGPSHAEEVALGIPTTNIAASSDIGCAEFIQSVFMSDNFRVYTGSDVLGVELGGALKNIIALCAGITDGIGFGDNTKAALMTRGIKEISRLGISMGADADTFWGLSGIGDLIVTCTSMHSRNRRAGILIGKGKTLSEALDEVHMVVEGVQSCTAAYELAKKHNVEMPIVEKAYEVLYKGKDPKAAVLELMQRDKKSEN